MKIVRQTNFDDDDDFVQYYLDQNTKGYKLFIVFKKDTDIIDVREGLTSYGIRNRMVGERTVYTW